MTARRAIVPFPRYVCGVSLLLVALASLPAAAATITVDTFAQFDAAKCTLANAINSANDDVNVAGCVRDGGIGADTIVLPFGTYALTVPDNGTNVDLTGLPVVTTDITIRGNGSTIARTTGIAAFFRIFRVSAGTLTLVEVTVAGGRLAGPESTVQVNGAGINVVAGGSLVLNRSTVLNNHIGPNVKVGQGGGIGALGTGTVTLTDSVVSDNSVTAQQGVSGNVALGGGIGTSGPKVTITRSRIANNLASADAKVPGDQAGFAAGGGIAAQNGDLTLSFVTVSNNTARAGGGSQKGTALGGGVDFFWDEVSGSPTLSVDHCTFSGNAALVNGGMSTGAPGFGAAGGAISFGNGGEPGVNIGQSSFIQNTAQADGDDTFDKNGSFARGGAIHFSGRPLLALRNVTLVNNSATARPGPGGDGGIAQGGAIAFETDSLLFLLSVTVTGNSVEAPAGGTPLGSGIASQGPVTIGGSIVIGNAGSNNCTATSDDGSFQSSGHNINPASGSCGTPIASDKPNVDPQLGALVDLGRPAGQYLPLLPTSPAIDAVDPLNCFDGDQLGQSRGGPCDMGAVERVPATAAVAAILPSTRAGVLGTKLTAFVTVINASPTTAFKVGIALVTPVAAQFFYQTTDAQNVPTGTINSPADIPPNGAQNFFISVLPTAAFAPTELVLAFTGPNASAPSVVGLNTLLVSASATPIPDLVALVATIGNNGIVDIPSSNNTGVFTLATVNLGASDLITVSTDTGGAVVPLTTLVCQTNAVGACLQPPQPNVSVQINTGETPTFGFFPRSTGAIPFDPAGTRLFIRLKDHTGAVRGGSSVAPRTVP